MHRQRRRGLALWRRALLRPGSERDDLLGDLAARGMHMGVVNGAAYMVAVYLYDVKES